MVSWGGLGGLCPPRYLRYPCLAPRGGSGGLRPPGIHIEITRPAVELGTRAGSWAPSRRSLGALSATWAPLLARSGLDWLALAAPGALAGSIWPRLARSGCPCCPGWLDLAALCAPGRPSWLDLAANDYPIDTISKKKTICLSTILLRCCLLRALWNVSSCLKSNKIYESRIRQKTKFLMNAVANVVEHNCIRNGCCTNC